VKRLPKPALAALVATVIVLPATAARGAMISLSEMSSNTTPASELDATLEFDVLGSVLTLTVTNDSVFTINQLYFNAPDTITALDLDPIEGWALRENRRADGFGRFDFALLDGGGSDPTAIDPGESIMFTLSITGTGPFSGFDFTSELSTIPPGSRPSIVAAKFVSGPGSGGFGATATAVVPAPATATILALGLLGRRRRRRA
jgi:hypothetical protein